MGADRYKQTAGTWMQDRGHNSSYRPSAPQSMPAYSAVRHCGVPSFILSVPEESMGKSS